jgi:hypothetical protein
MRSVHLIRFVSWNEQERLFQSKVTAIGVNIAGLIAPFIASVSLAFLNE